MLKSYRKLIQCKIFSYFSNEFYFSVYTLSAIYINLFIICCVFKQLVHYTYSYLPLQLSWLSSISISVRSCEHIYIHMTLSANICNTATSAAAHWQLMHHMSSWLLFLSCLKRIGHQSLDLFSSLTCSFHLISFFFFVFLCFTTAIACPLATTSQQQCYGSSIDNYRNSNKRLQLRSNAL